MGAATLRDLRADEFHGEGGFIEEIGGTADDETERMAIPGFADPGVDLLGFDGAFEAGAVLFVGFGAGGFDVDDGGVASEFFVEGGGVLAEEAAGGTGPIGEAVDGAAVAEDEGGVIDGLGKLLHLALDGEDGVLGRAAAGVVG